MRVKETQPPASEGPASRAVVLDKPLFQTHPLCTSVPPSRKMSIGRHCIYAEHLLGDNLLSWCHMQKEDILAEIRRTAQENGGKPLGYKQFEYITGIKPYDWTKYWARFGDAQQEAGFEPNTFITAYGDDYLLDKLAGLTQELGRFPTQAQSRMKAYNDPNFPNPKTFRRFGSKHQVLTKLLAYCSDSKKYATIVSLLNDELATTPNTPDNHMEANSGDTQYGFVYLFKSGRYYKIGMTKDTVRRGSELRIQLPERMDLIHFIQTDDPSGLEAYWHKRFEAKRMNGEWFSLNSADIKAFRRWRRIY